MSEIEDTDYEDCFDKDPISISDIPYKELFQYTDMDEIVFRMQLIDKVHYILKTLTTIEEKVLLLTFGGIQTIHNEDDKRVLLPSVDKRKLSKKEYNQGIAICIANKVVEPWSSDYQRFLWNIDRDKAIKEMKDREKEWDRVYSLVYNKLMKK